MNTSFIHPESLLHFFFHNREGLKGWIYTQKIKNHALEICFYFVGNGIISDPGYVTAIVPCHPHRACALLAKTTRNFLKYS